MKNGIKSDCSFPDMVQSIIYLDNMQNVYIKMLNKIQQLLMDLGSSEENSIQFSELYSSNRPQQLLQTMAERFNEFGNLEATENKGVNNSLKQLKFYLKKAKGLQSKINFLIDKISNLIVKLKSKKECQILITSLSLIVKKRQKFQIKQINTNNQLLKNLESLQQLNNPQQPTLTYFTIKMILESTLPSKQIECDSSGHTIKIELDNTKQEVQQYPFDQQTIYNQYLNYQAYQQYCYYKYINENQIYNQQFFSQYPYMFNYYYQSQQQYQ